MRAADSDWRPSLSVTKQNLRPARSSISPLQIFLCSSVFCLFCSLNASPHLFFFFVCGPAAVGYCDSIFHHVLRSPPPTHHHLRHHIIMLPLLLTVLAYQCCIFPTSPPPSNLHLLHCLTPPPPSTRALSSRQRPLPPTPPSPLSSSSPSSSSPSLAVSFFIAPLPLKPWYPLHRGHISAG